MDAAAAFAVAVIALAVVILAAVVARRRGGLHLDVRVWWGNGDHEPPGPDIQ